MNNKDWPLQWFNSPYYHILYKHRDDKEARKFIDHLIAYFKPHNNKRPGIGLENGSTILDMACGRGRHSMYFAEKGFDVTGVDISPESISYAQAYCEQYLPELIRERVIFRKHDMRHVLKKNYFDAVFNLFTSFGYFPSESDELNVLTAVHSQLKRNGIFVLDFMNIKRIIPKLKKRETRIIDNIKFVIRRSLNKGFIVKKISVEVRRKAEPAERLVFEERVKALALADFKRIFSESGFEIVKLFGDYELSNFDEGISERLIIVAVKC